MSGNELRNHSRIIRVPRMLVGSTKKPLGSFGNLDDGTINNRSARASALKNAPSVVSLTSFKGDECFFCCSGTVIGWDGKVGTIITSATLLVKNEDSIPKDVQVKVHLPSCETVPACVSYVDIHHNIALLHVESVSKLEVAEFEPFPSAFVRGQNVVALGRDPDTFEFMASFGEVNFVHTDFDCEDLLSSSCSITKYGIGGPLIDVDTRLVVGVNFCDETISVTPFLSSCIVLRCLNHLLTYGKVVRPWLGMKTRDIETFKISELEKMYQKFPDIEGVFVDKVIEGSPADLAGVCSGDVITHCDGSPIHSPLELAHILFDKVDKSIPAGSNGGDEGSLSFEVVIRRQSCSYSVTTCISSDNFTFTPNRWPLDKPFPIIRTYY